MTALIEDIITDAQELIGDVAGPGVQEYGDPLMLGYVKRGFNLVFKKYPWEAYRTWTTVTLDGSTGKISSSTALANIKDFEDFIRVCIAGEETNLPILGITKNPNAIPTGSRARCWTSLHNTDADFLTKRLKFYPVAATGSIDILGRHYPEDDLTPESTLYIDRDLLVYASAFFALSGDETNPGSANTCRALMDARFGDIMNQIGAHPIYTGGNSGIPTEWSA